jgi:hypothetical protein
MRWSILPGNATAEGGSNSGSDFGILRYSDAGAFIENSIVIARSTGQVVIGTGGLSIGGPLVVNGSTATIQSASQASLQLIVSGQRSWQMYEKAAGALAIWDSVNGDDLQIDTAGNVTVSHILSCPGGTVLAFGYRCRPGQAGAFRANGFNIDYTGAVPQLWIDTTNFGTFAFTSDYRTKRNIEPLPSMWERVKALKPVSYRLKDFSLIKGDDQERWGFVAHELQETLIEDAASGQKDQEDHIQSPNPLVVLAAVTRALQEAMTRIENLEGNGR